MAAADAMFITPLVADDLDPAAFAMWVDGAEKAVEVKDGPCHAIWTQKTRPEHDGVTFGDSNNPSARHLRIAWKKPLLVGTVLARSGGQVSALKPQAAYPGDLSKDSDWIPAQRIKGGQITRDETGREDYALWVLPPNTQTRALRFTHTPAATDSKYAGWIGGAFILSQRLTNVADRAAATASARDEDGARINDGTNNGTWKMWDNGKDGGEALISPEHPEWVMLTWPVPVSLIGLNALWAGFSAGDVQIYSGPADRHPREAAADDWRTITSIKG
ncbi:MAG: hypothetical protein NTX50_25840, partial [Candidatus Sumerlaeota bacterium]|nr:hypothetical protein [Candidatus Sumerlaeota bacterium]